MGHLIKITDLMSLHYKHIIYNKILFIAVLQNTLYFCLVINVKCTCITELSLELLCVTPLSTIVRAAISWRSVLLVEEPEVPKENHIPVASH